VSADKVERVRAAIATLHYRPVHAAAALARRRTSTVAFSYVASRLDGDLFKCHEMIALANALAERGLSLLLAPEDVGQADDASAVVRFALEQRLDGVVLTDVDLERGRVRALSQLDVPCVVYGANEGLGLDAVDVDESRGIAMAVEHLLGLGHTAIAFLAAPVAEDYARIRLDAYRACLAAAGLRTFVAMADGYRVADGQRAMARFAEFDQVSAIVCASDQLALGAMHAAQTRGRRIPEQISVVGFDDIAMAALASPRLTTVRQPVNQIASALVRRLVSPGSPSRSRRPRRQLVAPRLIVRESTAPPA